MGVVGQGQQTTHVYSASIVTSDPSSGIIEAVLPGSLRQVQVQGTPVAFRWPVAGEVWRIININGTFYLDSPLPIQDDSSTSAMSTQDVVLGTLSAGLSTNASYTALPVTLTQDISLSTFTLVDPTAAYTQSWATSGASEGATSLPVASQTPSYEFPEGSVIMGSGITTINDIAPGDAVLNSPTGKIWVMGSQDGSTDFSFDSEDVATWKAAETPGGDVSGPLDDLTVNTVKGGKTPLTANQNLADVASKSAALSNLGLFTSKWLFSDWTAIISVPSGSGTAYLCGWPTFTTGTTSEVWVFFAVCNAQANSANWTPMSCWFNTTWGNSIPSYQTGNTAAQTSDNSYWTIPCLYAVTIPANASGAVNFIGQGPSPFGWYAYDGYAFGLRVG